MKIGIDIDGCLTEITRFVADFGIKFCYENNIKYEFKVVSDKEEIDNYLLNNEIYPYAYIGDFRVALPKEKIDTIIKPVEKEIKINGKLYYKNYQYKKTIKNEYLEMGKGILFNITNKKVNLKLR